MFLAVALLGPSYQLGSSIGRIALATIVLYLILPYILPAARILQYGKDVGYGCLCRRSLPGRE